MKNSCFVCVLALASIVPCLYGKASKIDSNKKNEYLPATVLRVQKHETGSTSNYLGDNPSDAPLRSEVYPYEISLRVNCATYVGRYESAVDYLPAVFTPHRTVRVRLQKHVMYVNVRGDQEFRMGIVSHPRGQAPPCGDNH